MKCGWQRILSMTFLIAALGLFVAMHFLPWSRKTDFLVGELWFELWRTIRYAMRMVDPKTAIIWSSFLTFSLLIVVAPFLGKVWVKSLLAWSIAMILSAVTATGFWLIIFKYNSTVDLSSGGWCLLLSSVSNFVGLLLARPQWLGKPGDSWPAESQSEIADR